MGGGSEVDFHFFTFLIEGNGSYREIFSEKIFFLAKVIEFWISNFEFQKYIHNNYIVQLICIFDQC